MLSIISQNQGAACRKALFHSTAGSKAQFASRSRQLAKSLTPKSSNAGRLEVASPPPKPRFSREDAPHKGRSPIPEQGLRRVSSQDAEFRRERPSDRLRSGGESFTRWRGNDRDFAPRERSRRGEGQRFERRDLSQRDGRSGMKESLGERERGPSRYRDRETYSKSRDTYGRTESDPPRFSERDHRPGSHESYGQVEPDASRFSRQERQQRPHERYEDQEKDSSHFAGRQRTYQPEKTHEEPSTSDEFYHPSQPVSSTGSKGKAKALGSDTDLPAQFTSPPLLPTILTSLKEMLGPDARPTPIQSLSIKWLLENPSASSEVQGAPGWRQFLLAAETGSGKSIAYLLPVLQNIKQAELAAEGQPSPPWSHQSRRPHNPRGLIFAPTHELARQLSGFAKSLLHETKLRVMCTSQSNMKSTKKQKDATSSKMALMFQETEGSTGEFQISKSSHPVDLIVGTPMKLLEMVRGRGWDRKEQEEEQDEEAEEDEEHTRKARRGRDKMVGFGTWKSKPELGLANVEWVVVDEADVLFDPDFQETTRTLLSDISEARGVSIPVSPVSALQAPNSSTATATTTAATGIAIPEPVNYPFNLLLTSATIPNSLNTYLEKHHPSLIRLASPHLHHLPKTLQTEYVSWTGGNKFADIIRRIRRIWAEDAAGSSSLSKVLVFCNKSAKVVELSAYLAEQGVKSVAMTSQSEHRGRGSNRHLEGFLRKRKSDDADGAGASAPPQAVANPAANTDVKTEAHVMVTTSLLSRGLDFAPDIKHVFIVDEPRNMIDFIHRAGRSGRAGERGKVVVFGKMKGRGSQRGKDVRKRVGALVA